MEPIPQSAAAADNDTSRGSEPPATSSSPTQGDDAVAAAEGAEGAEGKGRPAEPASYLNRVLAEGHEIAEGDFCTICFLPIELPVSVSSSSTGSVKGASESASQETTPNLLLDKSLRLLSTRRQQGGLRNLFLLPISTA